MFDQDGRLLVELLVEAKEVVEGERHGLDDRRLELLCSMLVRAYDPCISCAVH